MGLTPGQNLRVENQEESPRGLNHSPSPSLLTSHCSQVFCWIPVCSVYDERSEPRSHRQTPPALRKESSQGSLTCQLFGAGGSCFSTETQSRKRKTHYIS